MDPQTLRSTFAVVERRAEHAVTFFYSHLFWHNPGVRELFPEDLRPQRDRLFAALTHVVAHLEDPALAAYLGRLGRDHRKFLASPALYAAVGTSLLAAFAHAAGPVWTVEAEKAWAEAYGHVADLMLAGAEEAAGAGEPAWWDTDVVRHERFGEDLAVLTLRPRRPLPFLPGQYVSVSSPRVPRVWRTYSLADAPRADGTVELHVSRIRGGAMSTALVDATRPGETLRLSAPDGGLVARTERGGLRTYICAGTGWAPVRALLAEAAEAEPELKGRLFVVARAKEYLYGRRDAERLKERLGGLSVTYITSAPGHGKDQATERLLQALRACVHWPAHDVYLAGPPGFLTEVVEALVELGTDPDRIHHDTLSPVGRFTVRPNTAAERLLGPPPPLWHNPEARAPRARGAAFPTA
ncbi:MULTISPECIES: globin domain-containing protein [unclassified Streptomyces]|uniref:globin domain-containing protein n=1 Tax=unclassified Streptomyces TaxID=2593676 RepID=UPI0006FA5EFD|nr:MULTISPECIES: globin domain-containing protein [unclassified Streptomyces]KQX57834.1 flavohemoprotein [Streptomyces sp. Root1304]KRA78718.1 flavohemoprotein [Streptomyces sp. Root66D1]